MAVVQGGCGYGMRVRGVPVSSVVHMTRNISLVNELMHESQADVPTVDAAGDGCT